MLIAATSGPGGGATLTAKLADLGHSRSVGGTTTVAGGVGTAGWFAPRGAKRQRDQFAGLGRFFAGPCAGLGCWRTARTHWAPRTSVFAIFKQSAKWCCPQKTRPVATRCPGALRLQRALGDLAGRFGEECRQLLAGMLAHAPAARPTAARVLAHPFLRPAELRAAHDEADAARRRAEDAEDAGKCLACWTRLADHTVQPCNHLCLCKPCDTKLRARAEDAGEVGKCPKCRQRVFLER